MPAKKSSDHRSAPADPQSESPSPADLSRSAAESSSGNSSKDFVQAAEGAQGGLLQEFWLFLRESKKWWLTPIILVLLLLAGLVVLAGTGAAPFIYTLF
ncbi:MAG: DUF5989 family protein [Acidobacteriota bacterium]|nr:DUF5989 family protein [Acidobacteriota bacterium]